MQTGDKAVVASHLRLAAIKKKLEGELLAQEFIILCGSLMAGIGKVENVVELLRVEHQRILLAVAVYLLQLGEVLLGVLTAHGLTLAHVTVALRKLAAQY